MLTRELGRRGELINPSPEVCAKTLRAELLLLLCNSALRISMYLFSMELSSHWFQVVHIMFRPTRFTPTFCCCWDVRVEGCVV